MKWREIFEDVPPANLRSPMLASFGFKQDNPGGEWLEHQIEAAASRGRPCSGAVTGWFKKDLLISAKWLHRIPGARNEDRKPGEGQYDRLMARVKEQGFDLSPDSAGLMGIDYMGEAYIIEGNTRASVATALGIDMIPFEVRYFAGGERIRGPFDPETICVMAELNTNARRAYPDD